MTQLPRPSMLTDRLSVSVDVQPAPPFSRPSRPRLLSDQHVQGRWCDAETASCFNIDNNYPLHRSCSHRLWLAHTGVDLATREKGKLAKSALRERLILYLG